MGKLLIFNFLLILAVAIGIFFVKKYVKRERVQNLLLICSALGTVLFHYSSLIYHLFTGGALQYLKDNPNLILPIYPCNVVMCFAVIFALLKNKKSKLGAFLSDYIFWFGIISALVGMFANVDFIKNPTLADFDNIKSIAAHATLLFNIILLPVFGFVKVDLFKNMKSIVISICVMLFIGLYCNLIFAALVSKAAAYDVNSMFLLHSPFEAIPFLTYPVIALIAVPLYFGLFALCKSFAYKKENRFYNRYK